MSYKRVLVNIPEELLDEIDQAARLEHHKRSEFVREALRDRVARSKFRASLNQVREQAKNDYSEDEVDNDIAQALAEALADHKVHSTL